MSQSELPTQEVSGRNPMTEVSSDLPLFPTPMDEQSSHQLRTFTESEGVSRRNLLKGATTGALSLGAFGSLMLPTGGPVATTTGAIPAITHQSAVITSGS